ncbi:MAG: hypothetical protein V9H69_15610 [Anaerolineae bacterium]
MVIDILVEGPLDEAVARRLIRHTGHEAGTTFGKRGVSYLHQKIPGFNARARYGHPILLLVDFMDTNLDCPPAVPSTWLPDRDQRLLLRVVVNEIESWLLADHRGIAGFLGVSNTLVPTDPEHLADPKQTLVNLARRSRRRTVQALIPASGITASVGRSYVDEMRTFVMDYWNVNDARQRASSLDRCVLRLKELSSPDHVNMP